MRWKKALALQKIFSLKRDLVDILKRYPNIFKMSNIESTKKKIWDEFYNNVGKNKDTAQNFLNNTSSLTKYQNGLVRTCINPRKGSNDPILNFKLTKNSINRKMQEIHDNIMLIEDFEKDDRDKLLGTSMNMSARIEEKYKDNQIRKMSMLNNKVGLAKSVDKISALKGLNTKITNFAQLLSILDNTNNLKTLKHFGAEKLKNLSPKLGDELMEKELKGDEDKSFINFQNNFF